MAINLWQTAGVHAFPGALHFVQVYLASGLCQRRLKSSDIFIKGPYNTESLSDALRATYKVLIESDDPLSSYSYQSSPHFRSAAIASRTPGQKKLWLFTTVLFMTGQGFHTLALIAESDNGFRIPALALHFTIICLYIWIIMTCSLKEDDAGRATVYFNATEKIWVTSSDFALFTSWERMEIPIKWSGELLFLVASGLFAWSTMLSTDASIIRNGGTATARNPLRVCS
ncbi:hypothetical protein V1523DRAFT_419210 [Lipomyces doorenjongii]